MNPPLKSKAPLTGGIFNLAGQYGVCVIGDHNVTYQIVVATQEQAAALLAELKEGRRKIEQVPQAAPLPTLVLQITPIANSSPSRWQLTCRHPAAGPDEPVNPIEFPSPRTPPFDRDLARSHEMAAAAQPKTEQRATLTALAMAIGDTLTALVPEPERKTLDDLGRAEGPPPFLIIDMTCGKSGW